MDRSWTRDFIVGLFVLAGLGALAYLSVTIGGYSWSKHGGLKLYAAFDETGDLAVRAPVVIAGVRVGEVTRISLGKNFRARVDFDLESSLQLPTDTTASIMTAGLLGNRFIELQPGGEDQILKTGDRINFTESAVILERVIGQMIYGATKGGGSATQPSSGTTAPSRLSSEK